MKVTTYAGIFVQLTVCLIFSTEIYGQTGKLFTVDSDLSSSLVEDIHQDRSGYIWIATEDGLNKYDGIKFTIYRQNQQVKNSILHNIVRVVSEDSSGRMYIGYINGLQYYEPATADFHTIPFVLDEGVIVDAHVKAIFQRKDGQLLVGTSGFGLFEIVREDGRLVGREMPYEVLSEMIEAIFEDSSGRLWVATEDQGLFRLDGGQLHNYLASKGEKIVISSMVEDRNGTLWFGSATQGLFKYVAAADTFEKIHYKDHTVLPVRDVIVTADNTIYVATDGRGIKSVDLKSETLIDLDVAAPTFSFSKAKMHSMLEDRDGNLWMGVYQKGVFMLPAHRHQFGYMGYKSVNRNIIGSNCIMSVYEDSDGAVWVGTDNDGLYRLDAQLSDSKHFIDDEAPGTVMAIFEDAKRNLWVGSYLDGLMLFDRQAEKFKHPITLTDKNGAKVERVFQIAEDTRQRLWVATMGSGLFRIDLNTNEVKRYNAKENSKLKPQSNHLPNDWINSVLVSGNKLYFGTYDGLGCLDLETEDFVSAFGRNRLFSDEVVYSLYDDKQGNLWVGTSTGLKVLNMTSLNVTQFDMADGLPSNTIWSIEGDLAGYIWLSTNRGVVRMDVDKKQFLNFHSGDGLQGDEFMRGVSMRRSDGTLFFGGLHGVSYFDPDEIQMLRKELSVHIVDFYLHNRTVSKGMKSGPFNIIDTTLHHETVFQLAYHDNSFAIEFSTMDFSDSERVIFQYAMNRNEWVHLRPSNNRITFENLPHGTHRLRVRAVAGNAISEIKELVFVVHPVWFLSTTAKVIYLLAAALLIAVVIRTVKNRKRARKQLRSQRRREEINDAKLQLFVSLAHEIRTPLTLIDSPLKKLMKMDGSQSHAYLYRIMDRNVRRMLDLVNQMMDAQKIEKGMMRLNYARVDMVLYTKEVCALFEEQLLAKDIRLTLNLPAHKCWAVIDPVNFDKVLVNVLSNACRFTPTGGWIKVELRQAEGHPTGNAITLSVADSGQPLDEQEMDRIFECFYQSDHFRNHNSGAGIGLYLAKQLMVLHGGEIYAENLSGGGCRFVMTLPERGSKGVAVDSGAGVSNRLAIRKTPVADNPVLSGARKQRKRVVVVDDDFDILNYLRGELTPFFNVTTFSDGEAAYKHVLGNPPDMIVSDIMMPLLDGFSLCSKIRSAPNTSYIPVILLTAKTDDVDNSDGFESGADAYITKPFNIDVLLKAIEGIIRNRELIRKNEREQHFQTEHISNVSIKSSDERLLEKVHQFIGEQLDNPLLSVEMIASEIGISRVHLHRKLKQLTNMTTRDLVRNIRLKQAAQMMRKNGLSVSEVAYAVGYADLSNFSISFKQMYGVSPSAYAAQKSSPGNRL